jgi:hypothetical protein
VKPSEVIRQAMAYLGEGWCRNTLEDRMGNVCARGAVCKAISGNAKSLWGGGLTASATNLYPIWSKVDYALSRKAEELAPQLQMNEYNCFTDAIVLYNNDVAKDVQDMLNLFEKTAIGLEEQGE